MNAHPRNFPRRPAFEMIAGRRSSPDNLLGNADLAKAALDKKWPFAVRSRSG